MDLEYFKQTFHFSSDVTTPLYVQLTAYIRVQIQAGVLKPGDQMLPENSIADVLKVSRTTVRQSMNCLVEEGLLIRFRGKGSFIASQKMRRNINYLYDFTNDMISLGAIPSSIVLHAEVIQSPPDHVVQALQLPQGQRATFYLDRLRCANGEPILWEQTYIPYWLCKGIERYNFENASLYHTLSEQFSLNLDHATETLEAVILTKGEAERLNCRPKVAGYKIRRQSSLDSGFSFEFTASLTRADRCLFQFDLYKNPTANKPPVEIQRHITLLVPS
ncbi:GntR family transcriptional regulator [Dictyobacter alpinus]|uniref:GntR family transcriptional regulator n=1 Tax=Dictyobacter alpinus TaxID=2014873 RepID=A0A402B1B9_9CHLR|nr:GntR family transcriptional regulator [Dictyobacter alpinus]GCE25138.1 GntR family transcriptional regulator [Dictyobacter alpinus]